MTSVKGELEAELEAAEAALQAALEKCRSVPVKYKNASIKGMPIPEKYEAFHREAEAAEERWEAARVALEALVG